MIYAVGDIHGELPLLEELLGEIRDDAARRPGPHKLVFVGDYVDRGLHSREVVELVMGGIDGFETICLKGNHEQMFLDFLEDPTLERAESYNRDFVGGRETLASYGIDLNEIVGVLKEEGDVSDLLAPLEGHAHIDWMNNLLLEHHEDRHMFVHAGIMPGIDLYAQQERHLLWIRDTFLDSPRDHGKIIVHGHSSRRGPELLPNRINIDTGACLFGVLTAVALEEEAPRLIQVRGERTAPFPSKELMEQRARERAVRGEA